MEEFDADEILADEIVDGRKRTNTKNQYARKVGHYG